LGSSSTNQILRGYLSGAGSAAPSRLSSSPGWTTITSAPAWLGGSGALAPRAQQLHAWSGDVDDAVASRDIITDLEATRLAILSLCIDLARWYHPGDDHKTSDEVGQLYAGPVARMILP
jgi:hypothetical protein